MELAVQLVVCCLQRCFTRRLLDDPETLDGFAANGHEIEFVNLAAAVDSLTSHCCEGKIAFCVARVFPEREAVFALTQLKISEGSFPIRLAAGPC
ncbi:MAG TPA: hypothetical protein VK745_05180 [Polyangiaceae bacterium]|nr:hypothetical protein [Polyangiaceae bacterium]